MLGRFGIHRFAFLLVGGLERPVDQSQIDLSGIHIDPADLNDHPIRQLVPDTGTLAFQLVAHFVEMIVIVPQFPDMHQPFNKQVVQLDENAETGHTGNGAREVLAQLVADEVTLQPCLDVT